MLRDLLKEGGLYTLANLLTKGISLLLIPFYTVYFSPADYGVIDFLNLFNLFITAIFTLQLNQGLARYVAEPTLTDSQKVSFASTGLWTTVLCLIAVTTVLLLIPDTIIKFLSSDNVEIDLRTYQLSVATIFFNGIFYLLGVHMRFLRMSRPFALLSFSHALLTILLILIFVIQYDLGIDSIYLSYLSILPILIGVQLYLLREHIGFKFSSRALGKLMSFSIPLIPAALATIIMNFADRVFIKQYLQDDFAQLGIYAMANKFSSIVGLIVAGFTMAIAPLIMQRQYEEKTALELGRILRLYFSVGTIGVLALALFSKETVVLITNERFHGAADLMPVMFLSAYFTGYLMFGLGMTIKKKTAVTAVLVIIFGALNVGLNLLMVPEFGAMGAAVATMISTFGYHAMTFFISQRYYPFPYSLSRIIPLSILHVAAIGFMMWWNPELSWLNVLIKVVIIVVYIFVLYFSNMLDIRRIIRYLGKFISKKESDEEE